MKIAKPATPMIKERRGIRPDGDKNNGGDKNNDGDKNSFLMQSALKPKRNFASLNRVFKSLI